MISTRRHLLNVVLQFGRRESMACGSLAGWASLRWPGSWGIEYLLSLAFSRQETGSVWTEETSGRNKPLIFGLVCTETFQRLEGQDQGVQQPCTPGNGTATEISGLTKKYCGANSYGQLGLGHKEDVLLPQQLNDFCKPRSVRRITGGGGHSAVVTDIGDLFVCGLNKDGQLGLGHTEDIPYFTPCKSLFGCPIQQVACGWDFTIILTENGQVLSCGSNSFGQLGVPHGPRRCVVPQAIELHKEKVVCIAAGLRHALAATASGIVFQWGTGLASCGRRLCPGQTLPLFFTAKEPSRVTGLENSKAMCVLAGSDHSASLTDAGEVYVWGSNKHGQLATEAAFLPVPQKIEAHCFQNEKVTAVWSGWTHLVAQTDDVQAPASSSTMIVHFQRPPQKLMLELCFLYSLQNCLLWLRA
ncbi:secretion-regulating guanine nucleotide exchange factor isoform X12 [Macaca nemestrina]|uniref:secretion-regulating guanine nucleotide exchange factor isoform X12 n=1 Tax=Macaca nemestrina TaxID=9545 RepID=UPI0039B8FAE1